VKINKALKSTLTLSVLIAFLAGCSGATSYVDDVGKISDDVAKAASKVGRQSGDEIDDAARVLGNGTDEFLKLAKERGKACAADAGANAAKNLIENAISEGKKQISQVNLFNVSKDAIQECTESKLGNELVKLQKSVYDNLLNQQADSVVVKVRQDYQGQIEFVRS
jgi:hypothetical protein